MCACVYYTRQARNKYVTSNPQQLIYRKQLLSYNVEYYYYDISQLLKYVPTVEEVQMLNEHSKEIDQMAKADRFLFEMSR